MQQMDRFWDFVDALVTASKIVIDRPRGTSHPVYNDMVYPLDYGHLEGTASGDGQGIDIWLGSEPHRGVTAAVATVDLLRRDAEIKLLIGCTPEEQRQILAVHNTGTQAGILLARPAGNRRE